jgi:hypothetical protein
MFYIMGMDYITQIVTYAENPWDCHNEKTTNITPYGTKVPTKLIKIVTTTGMKAPVPYPAFSEKARDKACHELCYERSYPGAYKSFVHEWYSSNPRIEHRVVKSYEKLNLNIDHHHSSGFIDKAVNEGGGETFYDRELQMSTYLENSSADETLIFNKLFRDSGYLEVHDFFRVTLENFTLDSAYLAFLGPILHAALTVSPMLACKVIGFFSLDPGRVVEFATKVYLVTKSAITPQFCKFRFVGATVSIASLAVSVIGVAKLYYSTPTPSLTNKEFAYSIVRKGSFELGSILGITYASFWEGLRREVFKPVIEPMMEYITNFIKNITRK